MATKIITSFFCLCFCSLIFADQIEPPIALVTGASSGIGRALVIELLSQGYDVVGISRPGKKLDKLKAEIQNDHLFIFPCDVTDLESVKKVSNQLKLEKKIPKFFFLNAGGVNFESAEPTGSLDLIEHHKWFEINYYGVLNFVKEWLEVCSENGGATFMVTNSLNAIFAPPGGSAYSASKAAISKAFDGFNLTYFDKKLKFLSVFCGPVDTPMQRNKFPFTWTAKEMAIYMIKNAKKGVKHSYPSWFYLVVAKLLNALPEKQVFKVLDWISKPR